jgi:hypothetical protein
MIRSGEWRGGTHLAKGALANGAVEVKVEEVDLAVEVDGVCTTTEDRTHSRGS